MCCATMESLTGVRSNNNEEGKSLANGQLAQNFWLRDKDLLRTYRERIIPARQKPSKKRRVLNMGTLTEKATVRPNISMNSTDMISTGWRPNLQSKFKISWFFCLWTLVNRTLCYARTSKILPVSKDTEHQVSEDGSHQQRKFCNVDFPC